MKKTEQLRHQHESAVRAVRYLYFIKPNLKTLLKWLAAALVLTKTVQEKQGRVKVLLLPSKRTKDRIDLQRMHDSFRSMIYPDANRAQSIDMPNFGILISLYLWIKLNRKFTDTFPIKPKRIIHKAIIFLASIHYFSSVRATNICCEKLIVFCDSVGLDAAISHLMKPQCKEIFCIQHGQYRFDPDIENSDLIPFLNPCGTGIFVWGDATRKEYERAKVRNYDVHILGRFPPPHTTTDFSKDAITKICLVLNGPDSRYVNASIIDIGEKIATSLGMPLFIKSHPADKKKYPYQKPDNEDNAVYICHSSGFIVEALLNSKKFLILKDRHTPHVYKNLPNLAQTPEEAIEIIQGDTTYWQNLFKKYPPIYVSNIPPQ